MAKSSRRSSVHYTGHKTLQMWWAELRENLNIELLGLLLFLGGGGLLLTLLRGGAGSPFGVPWLTQMAGWTAPWIALSTMLLGTLLMLHDHLDRLGAHWGVEAVVGVELLLLSLAVSTFLWQTETVTWSPRMDGLGGGVVGWALGSLLMAALGRWPAFAIVLCGVAIGLFYTLLYTPFIYLLGILARAFALPAAIDWARLRSGVEKLRAEWMPAIEQSANRTRPAPQGANYVAADRRGLSTSATMERDREPHMVRPLSEGERRHIASEPTARTIVEPEPIATAPTATVDANRGTSSKAQKSSDTKSRRKKPKTQDLLAPPPAASSAPPIDLLVADLGVYEPVGADELQELIENTLEDFNVPVKVVHVESGPTVTQFGVAPQYLERAGQRRKVRVNRIVSLADDLALALAVPAVRIEAPVPGRPYVGIEVPNKEKVTVSLRGVIESAAYQKNGGRLPLPLGRNTAGAGVVMDLTRAPHMLIAGSTGSGKSVCINTIITGLLMRYGPESLRFVMVDPKMVELPGYNGIPHMIGKVITEMDQVMGALTWLLLQMDDRYQAFKAVGVRNVEAYNALAGKKPKKGEEPITPLPYMVLIIDELADLMMTSADDIERQICRLAQMARATGIHLVIATQRPSTDVVTGLIKANFPTRVAFSVTSGTDSRVILDTVGAERLLGRGDMLVMRPDEAKLQRVQGCLVTDGEINDVVAFWKKQVSSDAPPVVSPWTGLMDSMDDEEGLIQDAIAVLQELDSCSTSYLQRKLKIGYPKAARLMEDLEKQGIVGPDMGGGQGREVLLKDENEEESVDEEEAPPF